MRGQTQQIDTTQDKEYDHGEFNQPPIIDYRKSRDPFEHCIKHNVCGREPYKLWEIDSLKHDHSKSTVQEQCPNNQEGHHPCSIDFERQHSIEASVEKMIHKVTAFGASQLQVHCHHGVLYRCSLKMEIASDVTDRPIHAAGDWRAV